MGGAVRSAENEFGLKDELVERLLLARRRATRFAARFGAAPLLFGARFALFASAFGGVDVIGHFVDAFVDARNVGLEPLDPAEARFLLVLGEEHHPVNHAASILGVSRFTQITQNRY